MKRKNHSVVAILVALALCFAACDAAAAGDAGPAPEYAANSGALLIKLPAEIALSYDATGRVSGIAGRDPEGTAIAEGCGDCIGQDLSGAIGSLMAAADRAGYLAASADGAQRSIILALETGSGTIDDAFRDALMLEVQTAAAQYQWSGNVEWTDAYANIDATTGASERINHDAEYYKQAATGAKYIGLEAAKAIALAHAGLAADSVSFSKAKFEDDDGRKEYEIEFYCNGLEYEYSIDAASGSIVEYERERDD